MQKNLDQQVTVLSGALLFNNLSLLIYIAVFACTAWQGFTQPVRNWDMLAYVGAVISFDAKAPAEIYDRVFAEVKPHVAADLYADYKQGPLSKDATVFYRQLPFYHIKPLYVRAVWLLHKAGVGLAPATWIISALAFALLGVALVLWRPERASYGLWLMSLAALTLLGDQPMGMLAGYSTPDALGLMLLMAGFMAWLNYKSIIPYAIGMLLAVLARPEALLQTLALTFYFTFFISEERRLSLHAAAAAAGLQAAAYLIIQLTVKDAPGWSTFFYSGFIDNTFDFTRHSVTITGEQYRRALFWGLLNEVQDRRLLFFAALSTAAAALHFLRPTPRHDWLWLLLMAWGTLALRFLLFPHWGDERYYYYYYILMLMASLEITATFIATPRPSPPV